MSLCFFSKSAHVLALTLVVGMASIAHAAPEKAAPANAPVVSTNAPAPEAQPDPAKVPSIAKMMQAGVKPYYLGRRANTDGWFLIKDTEMQIVYVPVGATDAIMGAMFDSAGDNITTRQIDALVRSNPQVMKDLKPDSAQPPVAVGAPAAAATAASNVSPGEALFQQLGTASGVVVGDAAAPLVMMVMDTNCTHCQATWKLFRDSVMNKQLRLRLIPISGQNGDSERSAAMLLSSADPLTAWDKYVAGDKSTLVGKPDDAATAKIRANRALIDTWKIDVTPFLVYRGKDQQVKIIRGEVKAPEILLGDLKP